MDTRVSFETLISAGDLSSRLDEPGWVVFDCRHRLGDADYGHAAYREGHIPGARFADMDETLAAPVSPGSGRHPLPNLDQFAEWLGRQGVGPRGQVIAYDDNNGAMAARLWWMMHYMGHKWCAVLDGGIARWRKEGRPLEQTDPRPSHEEIHHRLRKNDLVALEEVERISRDGRTLLIDARGVERFEGNSEPIDPVAGHIPGAVNLPFAGNLNPDGTFLPAAQLRERIEQALGGADAESSVHYCGSGVSACHNLLAMAVAGLPVGRLYAGSWSQWCADPKRPVETGAQRRRSNPA